MRTITTRLSLLCFTLVLTQSVRAQGTAFTYQGSLKNNGGPANGFYDLTFTVFGTSSGGTPIAGPVTNAATGVTNGLFTVTLDFGAAPFNGNVRWLEIGVRTNGPGSFSALLPRQELTPTPYAIFAGTASNLSGTISSSQLGGTYGNPVTFNNGANTFDGSFYGQFFGATFIGGSFVGSFIGSGSGLGDVWHTGGNIGTTPANFLGTIDNQALIFKVNNVQGARIDPSPSDSPNFTGGAALNVIDSGVSGAVIAGGGTTNFLGYPSANRVSASFSSISGGSGNLIEAAADHTTIGGGWGNWVQPNAWESFIGGGDFNAMGSQWSVLGGGEGNYIQTNSNYSFLGGGLQNFIDVNSGMSVIGGGWLNNILSNADQSVIAGGNANKIMPFARESFIGGGFANTLQTNAWDSFIGGGDHNTNASFESFIGGGSVNSIQQGANDAFIGGGDHNTIASAEAFIGGGDLNVIQTNTPAATIGGGYSNVIRTNSGWSSIGAGYDNVVDLYSYVSSIAGGYGNKIQGSSTLWSNANVFGSSIAGGAVNVIKWESAYSTIAGGLQNTMETNSRYASIGGGFLNTIQTNGYYSTIAGGYQNQVITNAYISTISGGYNNQAGYGSTVPGGRDNAATGRYSFAAGRFAHATNDGAFVFTDNQNVEFDSTADNQLSARFTGGVVFQTAGAGMTLDGQPILAGAVPPGGLSGTYGNPVTFSNPGNNFTGNGSGLVGVNASTLNGVPSTGFWSTSGNAGTTAGPNYIGTSDNVALLIKGSFVGIGRTNPITSAEYFGIQAPVSGNTYGGMYINTASGTGKPFYGYTLANVNSAWTYVDGGDGNKWKLNVNGSDRIAVTPAGLTAIGTNTNPDATLTVFGSADKPGGGSWGVFSDARLKKNVQPLEGALDRLMKLQGVTFEYKDPAAIHELPGTQVGMIAQEVEKVFPDWVETAPNGMKRLSIHGFEALTVEALRDLRKEKDAKLDQLETQNSEIRTENKRLANELAEQKETVALLQSRLEALEKQVARIVERKEQNVAALK